MSVVVDKSGLVSYSKNVIVNAASAKITAPTNPIDKADTEVFATWGDDNLYPQYVLEQIKDVTLIEPILDWKSRALYGGGLVYGQRKVVDGKESFEILMDEEIEEWLRTTDISSYLMEASTYFYYFANVFPEMILSENKSKINKITCKESTQTRWAKKSLKGDNVGLIETAYISAVWESGADIKDKNKVTTVPVILTLKNPLEQLKAGKEAKYIYPLSYPSPGREYYQNAPWQVLIKTWLPVAKAIPQFKKALLENQATIKYIVTVPEWWWKWKFADWEKKPELMTERVKETHDAFDEFMTGVENSGKSLMFTLKDPSHNLEYTGWDVKVVDDKLKEGIYIEDSQEADAHFFKNLNVDPTIFGSGPGKNTTSSGSGSDKRVAWNLYQLTIKAHQDLILKPLQFIAWYNKWIERLPGLTFMFRNYYIATLDQGKEISKNENN